MSTVKNISLIDTQIIDDIDLESVDTIVEETAASDTSRCVPDGDYTVKISLLPLKKAKDCEGATNAEKIKRSSFVMVIADGRPTFLVAERVVQVQVLLDNNSMEAVARKIQIRYNLRYRNTTEKVEAGQENKYSVLDYASLLQNCYMQAHGLTPKELAKRLKSGEVKSADLEAVLDNPEAEFYCAVTIKVESRDSADGTRTYENNVLVPRSITALDEDTVAALQSM